VVLEAVEGLHTTDNQPLILETLEALQTLVELFKPMAEMVGDRGALTQLEMAVELLTMRGH
jgi:hypothetical protein